MVKPNFLIIGAQKSGTTSTWAYLREHPDVHVANEKELNYFNHLPRIEPTKTVEWYEGNFIPEEDVLFTGEYDPKTTPVGEACPDYMFYPHAIASMAQYNPDFKLIVLLRDPVYRTISHYWWEVRMGNENEVMNVAFDLEMDRLSGVNNWRNSHHFAYKKRSRYVEQLDFLFEFFPREQVMIRQLNELIADPINYMNQITDFIGAPRWDGYSFEVLQKSEYDPPDPETVRELAEYFALYNQDLALKHGVHIAEWG